MPNNLISILNFILRLFFPEISAIIKRIYCDNGVENPNVLRLTMRFQVQNLQNLN